MPVIGNNGRAFLHGLSDFWLRFFKDLGDLETAYEGMAVLLGQTYLNLLSDVLNTSVVDTPLFKKEYYRLISIREDQIIFVDGGIPGLEVYRMPTEQRYGALPHLQNKVFAPTAGYEEVLDYALGESVIDFIADPTEPILDGFASRQVDIAIAGTFTDVAVPDWAAAGVRKGDVLVANRATQFDVSAVVDPDPPGTVRFTVIKAEDGTLYLAAGGTLPEALTAFSWRIERTLTTGDLATGLPNSATLFTGLFVGTTSLRVREIALWAVDALVDDYRLFTVYGHYFGEQRPSSEAYRSFIRGLMRLYVFGPNIERMESALNVMAGLPVIRDDNEILTGYDTGLDDSGIDGSVLGSIFSSPTALFTLNDVGGYLEVTDALNAVNLGVFQILAFANATTVTLDNTTPFILEAGVTWEYSRTDLQMVTTSRTTYEFPRRIPMRDDVVDPLNFDVLTFRAFEALTTATVVTDYIKDPEWWFGKTLPTSIVDRGSSTDRVLTPNILPNVIGDAGAFIIGDPGFYIGADEDGIVGGSDFHHRAAFILMDRFLKFHYFGVFLDRHIDLSGGLILEMQQVLLDLKPVDSTMYFTPFTEFIDIMTIGESLFEISGTLNLFDYANQIDNSFTVGSAWRIGETWKFAAASGGVVLANVGPAATYIDVAVGGADPGLGTIEAPALTFTPVSVPASEPIGYYISRPLHARAY